MKVSNTRVPGAALAVSFSVLLVVAGVYFWTGGIEADGNKREEHAVKTQDTAAAPTPSPKSIQGVQQDAGKVTLSEEEKAAVAAQFEIVQRRMREIDAQHAHEIFRGKNRDGIFIVRVEVPPWNEAQFEEMLEALTDAGRVFAEDSPTARAYRQQADQMERRLRRNPTKIATLSQGPDVTVPSYNIMEISSRAWEVTKDENGKPRMSRVIGAPEPTIKVDENGTLNVKNATSAVPTQRETSLELLFRASAPTAK